MVVLSIPSVLTVSVVGDSEARQLPQCWTVAQYKTFAVVSCQQRLKKCLSPYYQAVEGSLACAAE